MPGARAGPTQVLVPTWGCCWEPPCAGACKQAAAGGGSPEHERGVTRALTLEATCVKAHTPAEGKIAAHDSLYQGLHRRFGRGMHVSQSTCNQQVAAPEGCACRHSWMVLGTVWLSHVPLLHVPLSQCARWLSLQNSSNNTNNIANIAGRPNRGSTLLLPVAMPTGQNAPPPPPHVTSPW